MATATYELPYEGAKEMLLVEDVDSKEYLAGLFNAMYDELPVHKSNNKNNTIPVNKHNNAINKIPSNGNLKIYLHDSVKH